MFVLLFFVFCLFVLSFVLLFEFDYWILDVSFVCIVLCFFVAGFNL